jgi:lipooligosaccharide transport system permease protein
MTLFRPPRITARWTAVWRRNFLVWQKLAIPSMLGNFADPLMYVLALGYGLGALVGDVQGMSYVAFLATGTVCQSTMNTATFEALYSGFSRMHVQRTWDAILNAPVGLDDVVFGEMVWAASKAWLSGAVIVLVAVLLGVVTSPVAVVALAIVPLVGLCFAALGFIMTALAAGYDFFMYYFTLVVTPMALLSGVFFPLDQLPTALQWLAQVLPLSHAVSLLRPLLLGAWPTDALLHVGVLVAYAAAGFTIALALFRRRFSR